MDAKDIKISVKNSKDKLDFTLKYQKEKFFKSISKTRRIEDMLRKIRLELENSTFDTFKEDLADSIYNEWVREGGGCESLKPTGWRALTEGMFS